MPAFIAPCLATLADRIPAGERWQHEIKFDGYRLQLRRDGVDIRFLTRRGYNWTERFSNLVTPAWNLPCERCVIDGEVVIIDRATGLSDFGALQTAIRAGSAAGFTFLCLRPSLSGRPRSARLCARRSARHA
jgi:bifunctional non-homologous end joining protein LigD